MLDRLPPEILDAILVLTYPPSPWPDDLDVDKERRQTLCRLSLVCRAVGSRSQRVLWRKLNFGERDGAKVERLVNRKTPLLEALLGACPGLKKLQSSSKSVSWEQLESLSVGTLALRNSELLLSFSPPSSSALAHLTFHDVVLSQKGADDLLQPGVLPLLRVFELSHCRSAHTGDRYFPSISSTFAQQLDLLLIRIVDTLKNPPPALLGLPTVVLVATPCHWNLPELFAQGLSHLHIPAHPSPTYTSIFVNDLVNDLLISLSPSTTLNSLSLPTTFMDDSRFTRFSLSNLQRRDELLKALKTSGVEMFWHDDVQPIFPKAFWAYAKRLKAEAAEQANEA
ncbi:hypothetical protein JCM8097_006612 [Rhodosporidiobolus ruineniae]